MCLNLIKVKHKLKCFFESEVDRCKTREHHLLAPPVLLLEVSIAPTWGVGSTGEWAAASWAHHFTIPTESPLKYPSLNSRPHFSIHKGLPNQHIAAVPSASWILKPTRLISCMGLQMVVKKQVLGETKHWKLPPEQYGDGVREPGGWFSWGAPEGAVTQWAASPPWHQDNWEMSVPSRVRSSQAQPLPKEVWDPQEAAGLVHLWAPPMEEHLRLPLKTQKLCTCTHTNNTTPLPPPPPCQRMTPIILPQSRRVRKAISKLLHCF